MLFSSGIASNLKVALLHVQADLCDKPHDNKSLSIKITAWTTGIISIVAVILRFVSRHLGGSPLWWDDWLQLASIILVIPMTVSLLLNAEAGIGHHIWDLTYHQVKTIGQWTYITTICWALELLILKFSILCLYVRIFPNPWLKRAVMIFTVFTILYTGPLVFLAALQCIPVHAIWDLEAQKTAKCIDWIAVLRATVVFEVIAEVLIFVLPIPVVLRLKLRRSKKIQLLTFFGLGVCIIGISVARLPTLPGVVSSEDQPYTTVGATILGFVASVVGHVCAAVPTIRALVRLWCGSLDDSSSRSRPSRFGKGWGSSTASSGKRSSWFSRSQSYHSSNLLPSQNTDKEKSAGITVQQHFGVQPLLETREDVVLLDLQPIRERAYQPARPQRGVGQWNSGRPRWVTDEEQPPSIIREPWKEADIDDSSSEKDVLPNQGFARTSSVRAIEEHIHSMEARMLELETEIQFYRSNSVRGQASRV
ncbi:uncharacterized protein CC84DRAFT_1263222 [Paraphaeosphaeria sporulosa]|uniref:Rhodopsin domain-containing protein n=1 Tax=Paraphaeosphaeria sporulosa TaxID=1460663 RepID=A0A177C0P8_9PLEO|nr:uncharacterized protein CC84DRAFT_1263222 [Paraphaeosphaeria sporulosa]OAG01213.1 hypothetical protein CC84DRAFT_1263222 [Paraphaeosphaeria sporulosa]